MSFFEQSVFFGMFISLSSYMIGLFLYRKFKIALLNPLLISVILCIAFLAVFKLDYSVYLRGAKYLSHLLTPATVCLAIPLYEKLSLLKKNFRALAAGICTGVISTFACVFGIGFLFGLERAEYITLLPKSVTTAIGIAISEQLGGYVTITVAVILITGITGNMLSPLICRVFKITDPIARGVAIGCASHAVGTAKAAQMGEIEGAVSSLSLVVTAILTLLCAAVAAQFL